MALQLLSTLRPDVVRCSSGVAACGARRQWRRALGLLEAMRGANGVSYRSAMRAARWAVGLEVYKEMVSLRHAWRGREMEGFHQIWRDFGCF